VSSTAVAAWMRLARVYHKMDRATMERLRPWELSVAQFDVLAQVGAHEGLTQQELAAALLVTKGNICQLLDRLERVGLVRRQQEGRANRLYLTEAGRALHDQVVPAQEALVAERLAALTPDEQAALLGLLRKLDHAFP
jgi:DNA-binding MarR family transcriptional regulator